MPMPLKPNAGDKTVTWPPNINLAPPLTRTKADGDRRSDSTQVGGLFNIPTSSEVLLQLLPIAAVHPTMDALGKRMQLELGSMRCSVG